MEDASLNDIVSWTEDGKAFTIYDVHKFTEEVMPLHFSHDNFSSFHRQLHTYVSHPSRGLPTRIYRGFNHRRVVWNYTTVPVIARGRGMALDSAPGPRSSHPPRSGCHRPLFCNTGGDRKILKKMVLTSSPPSPPSIAEHLRASVRSVSRTPGPSPTPIFSGAAGRTSTGLRAKVSRIREGTRRCRSPSRSKGWRCSRTRGAWVWAWADRSSTRG